MDDVEPKTSSPEDLISTKDDAKTSTRAASTESAEGAISAPSPPRIDGGSKAWLTLAGTFIALFCGFGQMSAFGTFQTYYADHQLRDLPASTISWIGSVAFWMFFFSGGFVGRLFDAFGPRIIMLPGSVLLCFSIMMTSLAKEYYQFMLTQGVLFGGSMSLIFFPSLAALSTHFNKRRGTAIGIAFAGAGFGGVVYPIMFQHLFAQVGYAWTVRINGFLSLFLALFSTAAVTSTRKHGRTGAPIFNTKTFRDVNFMVYCLACMCVGIGIFIPFFYLADYAEDHGIPQSTAFYILSAINAGSILGRVGPPLASDVVGRFNMTIPAAWLMGVSALLFWNFATTLVQIVWFAIFWGVFSGTFIALMIPCVGEMSELHEIGVRIGLLYSIISFGTLSGAPAAGALLRDEHGSYRGAIGLCGAASFVGGFLVMWVRFRLNPRLWAKV